MSYDGIVTRAVVEELKNKLVGCKIEKVYQQEKDEILIHTHGKGANNRLIISASSNNPRVYLTNHSKKNPTEPPMFCMLLRKHLTSGIILNIEQFHLDRIIFIDISAIDELGLPTEKRLIVEIMGKHSNIILVDKPTSKIIDSITRVYEDMSRVRQILPGGIYEYPPLQDKLNLLDSNKSDFMNAFNNADKTLQLYKFLYFNYLGLSPLISKKLCFDADILMDRTLNSLSSEDVENLYKTFEDFTFKIKNNDFEPNCVLSKNKSDIVAFHAISLTNYGLESLVSYDSISELLDSYYKSKDTLDRVSQKSQSIKKSIQIKLDRTINKLVKQNEELLESADREKFKIYGDLISANLYNIPKGAKEIELDNFYDENMAKIIVPLDFKLSPVLNAQKYYKKYSKLKNAHNLLLNQTPETEQEILYLENVLMSIENSTEVKELDETKEELIVGGYIKGTLKKAKKNKEETISKPLHFLSIDGFNMYVGKNNKQNEHLTLKFASREDLWLHVQNMPGSHVIVKSEGKAIPDSTLEQAAILAAYYSKGKNSNNVTIDYTQRRNVKKHPSGKVGLVSYDNFKSVIITPTEELVDSIIKVNK